MAIATRTGLAVLALAMIAAGCHRRESGARRGEFAPCAGQRYLTATNSTNRTYDVYLRTSNSSRIYIATVYPESRIDVPIDPSITAGTPEFVEQRIAGRIRTADANLGAQYGVIVCRS